MSQYKYLTLLVGLLFTSLAHSQNPACIDNCAFAFSSKNYATAIKECTTAAEYGNVLAQRFLGTMYAAGWGTQKDYAKSAVWLRKAADQGDAVAQKYLSKLEGKPYQPPIVSISQNTPSSQEQTPRPLPPVMETPANSETTRLSFDEVYQNYKTNPLHTPISKLKELASQDDPRAIFLLGHMHRTGYDRIGIEYNLDESARLYKMAGNALTTPASAVELKMLQLELNADHETLSNSLSLALKDKSDNSYILAGKMLDVAVSSWNAEIAFKLFKKLAVFGDHKAQLALSMHYKLGRGTTVDLQEAEKWLKKSGLLEASVEIKSDELFVRLADTFEKSGFNRKREDKEYADILKNGDPEAMYDAAIMLEDSGKVERALGVYQAILDKFPNHLAASRSVNNIKPNLFKPDFLRYPEWVTGRKERSDFSVYSDEIYLLAQKYINTEKDSEKYLLRNQVQSLITRYGDEFQGEARKSKAIASLTEIYLTPFIDGFVTRLECSRAREFLSNLSTVRIDALYGKVTSCEHIAKELKKQQEDEQRFADILNNNNPQVIYISALKYEDSGDIKRVKQIYKTIIERFPEHPMALKAADSLAALKKRVEQAEMAADYAEARASAAFRRDNQTTARSSESHQTEQINKICSGQQQYVGPSYCPGGLNNYGGCDHGRVCSKGWAVGDMCFAIVEVCN